MLVRYNEVFCMKIFMGLIRCSSQVKFIQLNLFYWPKQSLKSWFDEPSKLEYVWNRK